MNQPGRTRETKNAAVGYGLLIGIIVAAGFAIAIAFSAGMRVNASSEGHYGTKNQAPSEAQAKDASHDKIGGYIRPIDDEAGVSVHHDEEAVKSSQEDSRAEQSLKAQQSMSQSAENMNWIAFFNLVLTAFALGFIMLTYHATKAMVGEAEELTVETIKATKAMVKQNELTEFAQRPWLKISFHPEMASKITLDPKSGLWTVYRPIILQNWGQSPAKDIELTGQGWLEKPTVTELPKKIPKDGPVTEYKYAPSIVFPSEVVDLGLNIGGTLTQEQAASQTFVFAIEAAYESQGVRQSTTLIAKVEPLIRNFDVVEPQRIRTLFTELRAT